jgi:glycine oxidase
MAPDVIVVGAGAIGTSIAFQAAKAGARVLLLDRGPVGGEATGASAGMIQLNPDRGTPAAYSALATESARLFPALAAELLERTGIDIGFRPAPLLHVALDEAEEAGLRAHRGWQVDQGMSVGWLDGKAALDAEPALTPAVRAALLYQDHHQLLPRALARAMARAAADLGTVVREGVAVDRLLTEGSRVTGVGVGGDEFQAPEVVIANGAWASVWSTTLGTPIPVRPVRGQMVGLSTSGTLLRHVISSSAGYVLGKADGSTLVGTTVEEVGFDARPTAAAIAGLLAFGPRLVPRLADATVGAAWAGLRPGTPDHLPLLGRLPRWGGVLLAAGHFREGILLAPITGELVSDLLSRRRPRLPIEAFDPGRFLVRAA